MSLPELQLWRNAKFVTQSSVVAVGQMIILSVHVWELIVMIVSPSASFVQRLTAKTVLMVRKMTSSSVWNAGNRLVLCVGLACRKSALSVWNYICLYNESFLSRGNKTVEPALPISNWSYLLAVPKEARSVLSIQVLSLWSLSHKSKKNTHPRHRKSINIT